MVTLLNQKNDLPSSHSASQVKQSNIKSRKNSSPSDLTSLKSPVSHAQQLTGGFPCRQSNKREPSTTEGMRLRFWQTQMKSSGLGKSISLTSG